MKWCLLPVQYLTVSTVSVIFLMKLILYIKYQYLILHNYEFINIVILSF